MITLAPFYRDVELAQESQKLSKNSGIVDYRDCLRMLIDTLQRTNPTCNYRVCTDRNTPLPFAESNIFRSDLRGMPLIESLVVSNTEFVKQHQGDAVLCGADHLLANSMRDVFNHEFDIALMYNGDSINNTVVLIRNTPQNHNRVVDFFQQRQQAYYSLDEKNRLWLGDQISYSRVLSAYGFPNDYRKLVGHTHQRNNLTVKFLEYNRDFVWGSKKSSAGFFQHAVMVDFKGPSRKQWFTTVYRRIMNLD